MANGGTLLNSYVRPHKPMRIDAGSKWRRGIKSREIYEGPSSLKIILVKWARTTLVRSSANEALDAAAKVRVS